MAKISVIIPVYNTKVYVGDCLDSILDQTIPFDEIIVVNDGSADGSELICREYQMTHPEIILVEQTNMGLSEARNSGMRRATGDYIVFVDSDDWAGSTMCQAIKKTVADHDVDVVFYASGIVKEIPMKVSDEIYSRDPEEVNKVMSGFESLKKMFPSYYEMSACMAAYSRRFLEKQKIDFIKNILYEDRFFSLRVITEAERVIYIADKLYIRRFRASSIITSPASKKKIRDVLYGHRREWEYIRGSRNWQREKSLTQYFALCGALMACREDVSSEKTQDEREEYLEVFFGEWLDYFVIDSMSENELCELLLLVNQTVNSGKGKLMKLFEKHGGVKNYQGRIRDRLLEKYRCRLMELPFGEKKRVAVYGAGAHTECLLRSYRNLIGAIAADIYLLVSDGKDVEQGGDIPVRTLDNGSEDTDAYILSSKVYQRDMYRNLRERHVPEEKIKKMYEKTDAVDCVMLCAALCV